MTKEKKLIGRREMANLPEFGLQQVAVKIDSGAYSCSIHVSQCKEIVEANKTLLSVRFLDESHASYTGKDHVFEQFRKKKVKSSTGHEQLRYFVYCTIELMGEHIRTEFSLTERKGMRYPILLGRKLLNRRFIIDTSLVNVSNLKKT